MPIVTPPMFISARLMAALKIEGAGTIHIHARNADPLPHELNRRDRIAYSCIIEDADGTVLYDGDGIRSGAGQDVDYAEAMATTLHFISHDADQYRACKGDWSTRGEDGQPVWNEAVAEWAYQHDGDLFALEAYELDPES